jgi:hypothetical protein
MTARIQMGEAASGLGVMKFTLTYDGELRANGRAQHKQEIRRQLSPQIEELWKVSPALQFWRKNKWVPRAAGFGPTWIHHSVDLTDWSNGPPPTERANWLALLALVLALIVFFVAIGYEGACDNGDGHGPDCV